MNLRPVKSTIYAALALAGLAALPAVARAQGSIFGAVQSSDLSTPEDGAIQLLGFINNSDREIRIQSCIGAGYSAPFWFDDFQNYLTEVAGQPYRYYLFDTARAERALLSGTIPTNSFQQQDMMLSPSVFPVAATRLESAILESRTVRLDWKAQSDVTWHVYRRDGSSGGSFFRLDSPTGDLNNHGVAVPYYIDNTVDSLGRYWYVLVTESTAGNYSPASEMLHVDVNSCCQGHVGDINGVGGDTPTIGDIMLLIDHLFISMTTPECLREADVNQSGGANPAPADISLADVAILIDHLFINGNPLRRCSDAGQ